MAKAKQTSKKLVIRLEIRKGDVVEVITGNDKGKRGKVLKIFPEMRKLIIERVHFMKKHVRPTRQDPKGGIQERETPIHISNVMLVCPNCNSKTRIGHHKLEDGSRVRICRLCKEMVDNR